jgi:hypothetical protein
MTLFDGFLKLKKIGTIGHGNRTREGKKNWEGEVEK